MNTYKVFENLAGLELKSKFNLNIPQITKPFDWVSPDSSGNPFCFFFKNKKIVTDSGKKLLKNTIKNYIFAFD